MAVITIQNLKSVGYLKFEIPQTGVHVLTGINGSGKTTLLTCLQRITDQYAFQRHFRTSGSQQFDSFQSSSIKYEHNGRSVEYIYRNTRWSPNPRRESHLLSRLGFSSAIFISSAGERFYVQNEELSARGLVQASPFIRNSMNSIFETPKYADLRRKKLDGKGRGAGRWNYGFVLPLGNIGNLNRYYAERNFSLGEILILNALFKLERISNNSLVLIDEIELALHPRVQVQFLRFLQERAIQQNLTIILSTHSSSLIKLAGNLIYLDKNDATRVVSVAYDCYPAIALQKVAVVEEVQPDVLFFVEDDYAKYILEKLLHYYFTTLNRGQKPIIKILPVGGWKETLKLAVSAPNYLLPQQTLVVAVLDSDAESDIADIQQNAHRTPSQQELLNLYNLNRGSVRFLPITPELGLVDLLNNNPANHIQPLQTLFQEVFDISQIIREEAGRDLQYSNNNRKAAKMRLPFYVERISNFSNRDLNYVRIKLAEYFASSFCPQHHGELQRIFNPIFN